ncbi:MAG: COX15/CtaA family protein [Acidimicrobiia bacterium]|nr:COX15/CtaA family protein [Acidimicrobiia bacterium]
MREVQVPALVPGRLEPVIGPERFARFTEAAARARALLEGRRVLNVNSTSDGGGVAEMLRTLVAYARGSGVDARWVVIEGDPEFFAITKRIHNGLYGSAGDGGPLGPAEREHYERVIDRNAPDVTARIRPGDVVILHDPQTAGMTPRLRDAGATVVWRCHVGVDVPDHHVERSWAFLRPFVELADASVFSRASFAPPWIDRDRMVVIPPSIDPFSAKNEAMSPGDVVGVLRYVGALDGRGHRSRVRFSRPDGRSARVSRRVDLLGTGPPPEPDVPLVVQVSRWDRMKDMTGVLRGFAQHVDGFRRAHLMLAGPASVSDDPEGAEVLDECLAEWEALAPGPRSRVHLACIPFADFDEGSAITNALQRHAGVVVQKSLAEGFGLTVTEAMWKARPVVASAVGGSRTRSSTGTTASCSTTRGISRRSAVPSGASSTTRRVRPLSGRTPTGVPSSASWATGTCSSTSPCSSRSNARRCAEGPRRPARAGAALPSTMRSRMPMPTVSPRGYRRIALFAAIVLGVIIVSGGAVRLSESGLGCSDWPNCEPGRLAARADDPNAMVEFVNRVFTGLISVAVILAVLGSLVRRPRRRDLVVLSSGLVLGLLAQIVLGGLTVKYHLAPPLVMAHFLLSVLVLWNAVVLHHRSGQPEGIARPAVSRRVVVGSRVLLVAAWAVLVTGTLVTGSGPHSGGGEGDEVERLGFPLPEITRVHGVTVMAFLALALATLWLARRERALERLQRPLTVLLVLVVAQAAVGYAQYLTGVPELLVGIHLAGATLVWTATVLVSLATSERVEGAPAVERREVLAGT